MAHKRDGSVRAQEGRLALSLALLEPLSALETVGGRLRQEPRRAHQPYVTLFERLHQSIIEGSEGGEGG